MVALFHKATIIEKFLPTKQKNSDKKIRIQRRKFLIGQPVKYTANKTNQTVNA